MRNYQAASVYERIKNLSAFNIPEAVKRENSINTPRFIILRIIAACAFIPPVAALIAGIWNGKAIKTIRI